MLVKFIVHVVLLVISEESAQFWPNEEVLGDRPLLQDALFEESDIFCCAQVEAVDDTIVVRLTDRTRIEVKCLRLFCSCIFRDRDLREFTAPFKLIGLFVNTCGSHSIKTAEAAKAGQMGHTIRVVNIRFVVACLAHRARVGRLTDETIRDEVLTKFARQSLFLGYVASPLLDVADVGARHVIVCKVKFISILASLHEDAKPVVVLNRRDTTIPANAAANGYGDKA